MKTRRGVIKGVRRGVIKGVRPTILRFRNLENRKIVGLTPFLMRGEGRLLIERDVVSFPRSTFGISMSQRVSRARNTNPCPGEYATTQSLNQCGLNTSSPGGWVRKGKWWWGSSIYSSLNGKRFRRTDNKLVIFTTPRRRAGVMPATMKFSVRTAAFESLSGVYPSASPTIS